MGVGGAFCAGILAGALAAAPAAAESAAGTETLIFFRHGEKPTGDGLGQLTCQGLNRALALAGVLPKLLGQQTPSEIMVPDPAHEISDGGKSPHYYVRPVATVEPYAIRVGMPVNTKFAYDDVAGVVKDLKQASRAGQTILIAWEHAKMVEIIDQIYSTGVPKWEPNDYDRMEKITIEWDSGGNVKSTKRTPMQEGITPSQHCPEPAK